MKRLVTWDDLTAEPKAPSAPAGRRELERRAVQFARPIKPTLDPRLAELLRSGPLTTAQIVRALGLPYTDVMALLKANAKALDMDRLWGLKP